MQTNVHLRLLMDLQGVVPSRHGNWVRLFRSSDIDINELALDPDLFPVLNFAYAGVLEFLGQVILRDLLLVVIVRYELYVMLFILDLETHHRVRVVFQGRELILIELALLDVVENNHIVRLEVTDHDVNWVLFT